MSPYLFTSPPPTLVKISINLEDRLEKGGCSVLDMAADITTLHRLNSYLLPELIPVIYTCTYCSASLWAVHISI